MSVADQLQNFHGVVQRLVQKEKQVLQLQTELERFKTQNPGEDRDAVCLFPAFYYHSSVIYIQIQDERAKRERDRLKWNTLMEEISKLKIKVRKTYNRLYPGQYLNQVIEYRT